MVNKGFEKLGALMDRRPVKTLMAALALVVFLIAGALQVTMSTGSETLVRKENPVFVSNRNMESHFGSDAIMVVFQGDEESLTQVENLTRMHGMAERLQYQEGIFSILSPATLLHSMTEMQSEEIRLRVLDMAVGLDTLAKALEEVGTEMGSKEVPDAAVLQEKLENFEQVAQTFQRLAAGQAELAKGTQGVAGGMGQVAEGLEEMARQLMAMGTGLEGQPQLSMQLARMGENLQETAGNLETMGANTQSLSEGNRKTESALRTMSENLETETGEMAALFSEGITREELQGMAEGFLAMGEHLSGMSSGLSTFHEKSAMLRPYFPVQQSELELLLLDEDGQRRSLFEDVILDDHHMLMVVKLQGNMPDTLRDEVVAAVTVAVEKAGLEGVTTTITGKPVLDDALRTEMKSNMQRMIAFAVAAMFLILMAVFKIRWRAISLLVIFIAVLGTLGLMGHLSVPMTMVSMAVFPILIGLGIDYSIQFQNRYEEEKSPARTLTQVGKAVGIAVLATMMGFVSLFASPVPMIQDFGKMLTIGVLVSFIASIFLLIPILRARDVFDSKTQRTFKVPDDRKTQVDRILEATTGFVTRHAVPVLLLAVLLAGMGMVADRHVGVETDIETFMPQEMEALQDMRGVRDILGSTNQVALFLEAEDVLAPEILAWMRDTEDYVLTQHSDAVVGVKSIDTVLGMLHDTPFAHHEAYTEAVWDLPEAQRKMVVDDAGTRGLVILSLSHMPIETMEAFIGELGTYAAAADFSVAVTGMSVLDVEMVEGLTAGRVKMTLLGLGLVFLALLLVYRSLFKAFAAVFPIALIVGMSGGLMYLLDIRYTPITATLGALVLGMGTEMTILLLERYLEERHHGRAKMEALEIAVRRIGKATVASGLTTIGGFSVLMASEFVILKDFGLMTVLNISLALASTFLILPAVLVVMDRFLVGNGAQGA